MSTTSTPLSRPAHQRRLRSVVKRLVIELAHLETCLDSGVQDARVMAAADGLDEAIDGLNEYLAAGSVRVA
jgi:hypothetical protein